MVKFLSFLQDGEKYKLADPICTYLFSVLVLITTIRVLKDTLHVVLEGKFSLCGIIILNVHFLVTEL